MLTARTPMLLAGCLLAFTTLTHAQDRWHVDASLNTGNNDGTSWPNAFQGASGLQAALALADSGDEIWLADGTYLPSDSLDRAASFEPADGVTIYGGFAGFESTLNERDWNANIAILSGDLTGNDLPDFVNRTDNAYHVVHIPTGSVVFDGLTIRGGIAQDEPGGFLSGGGVVVEFGAVITIRNAVITQNEARSGGGVEIHGAAHLDHSIIKANRAAGVGFSAGGGANSLVAFNTEFATFTNCLIFGNTALHAGGGIAGDHSGFVMTNCTVVGNRVTDEQFGGGLALQGTFGTLEIANTIVWGNSTTDGSADELTQMWNPNLPDFLVLNHTTIQGFTGTREFQGSGNSGLDPDFVDPLGPDSLPGTGDEDYRLMGTSAVIDAGANAFVPPEIETDLAGSPRFVDVPSVPDTGSGSAPIVDLGAYENQSGAIPAASHWGLIIFSMILLVAGTKMFRQRSAK